MSDLPSEPPSGYRCNCGRIFPEALARTAHAGSCGVMQTYVEAADLRRRVRMAVEILTKHRPPAYAYSDVRGPLLAVLDPVGRGSLDQTNNIEKGVDP